MAAQEERLVPSSQAKLDELFLHWLSLPDAQQFVLSLLSNVRKGKPIGSVGSGFTSPNAEDKTSGKNLASPPPRSPTGRSPKHSPENNREGMWMDTKDGNLSKELGKDGDLHHAPHQEDAVMQDKQHPAARKPDASLSLPRFYNPKQPSDDVLGAAKLELEEMTQLFNSNPEGLNSENFISFATKVCGYPSFLAPTLFEKLAGDETKVSQAKCRFWWENSMKHKKPEARLFDLLKGQGSNYVTREDWMKHLRFLLDTHPGLDFLKGTPEFQDRYLECVVERIFYVNNRAENDKMTQLDFVKSNLVKVLKYVDEEPDINKVLDYFSYEHFYVLYCKFWELDNDHDFLLDRDDLVKLSNYALTYRIVDRIFSGACKPLSSGTPDKLGYQDFIWLLLSEEDKHSETAIRYWFRGIDLDGDGYITPHEMEYFYKEQLHRMDCLAQEVVQFEDILCQMTDMVKPAREGYISMLDLKRCKQPGVFFNVLFNLTKFIQYDQKDPGQIFNERATPELTDWDRYAKIEYARLAMEEDQGEYADEIDFGGEGGDDV